MHDEVLASPVAVSKFRAGAAAAAIRFGSALVLVILCLGVAFQCSLDRVLTRIGASTTRGLLVIDDLDSIIDALDRLSLSQRSFLHTGDLRFSQDVAESVMRINGRVDSLRRAVVKPDPLRDATIKLSGAIDCGLKSMRRSNEVEQSAGTAAALTLLDNDVSMDDARIQAEQVRRLATDAIFDRVRAEHRISIFDLLF